MKCTCLGIQKSFLLSLYLHHVLIHNNQAFVSSFTFTSLHQFSTNNLFENFHPISKRSSKYLNHGSKKGCIIQSQFHSTSFKYASLYSIKSTSTDEKLEVVDDDNVNSESINIIGGNTDSDRLSGVLVLLTVPLAWGTYAPVVKYVYDMDPPVPGFVFSAAYYVIAAITLTLLSVIQKEFKSLSSENVSSITSLNKAEKDERIDATEIEEIIEMTQTATDDDKQLKVVQRFAGLELGSYLFLGNCLQVIGLKQVPADRAAFLVQLTTIMVPLLQAGFAGDFLSIPLLTWLACILAFVGVIVMGLDGPNDLQGLPSIDNLQHGIGELSFNSGDGLITLAAVAYSMHVIRLGRYAKFTGPLELATSKATVEALLSIGLVTFLLMIGQTDIGFLNEASSEIKVYFDTLRDQISVGQFPPSDSTNVFAAVLWTAWITCAYTIYAQSFGQRRLSPTDANLIYSMQPLFSALFAFVLLKETLGPAGYLGGLCIGSALWIVTSSQNNETKDQDILQNDKY